MRNSRKNFKVKRNTNDRYRSKGSSKNIKNKGYKRHIGLSTGKKIIVGVCIVLLILVLVAIVGVAYVGNKMGKLNVKKLNLNELSISDEVSYDESGYLNVALFGLDTRATGEVEGTRSDCIMVASLNCATKEVRISSIYRDTLLQQKDGTYNKANAAYSFGGAEEAVAMLNKNLDLDIQHYITVDFGALVDVIDALGGVEIDVTPEEIPYINGYGDEITRNTGVETPMVTVSGLQNLTGVQATAYARIRYTAGDDYKRAERQRLVLAKIAEKAQQADLATLNKIIDKVFSKVETNFTLTEILAYAKDVQKYKLADTTGFPENKDTMDYEDAGNVVVPLSLESNVKILHQYLFGEDGYTPSSTLSEINSEIEVISQNGGIGVTSDDSSSYNNDVEYGSTGYDQGDNAYSQNYYDDSSTTYYNSDQNLDNGYANESGDNSNTINPSDMNNGY